jgi:hypothetical protein
LPDGGSIIKVMLMLTSCLLLHYGVYGMFEMNCVFRDGDADGVEKISTTVEDLDEALQGKTEDSNVVVAVPGGEKRRNRGVAVATRVPHDWGETIRNTQWGWETA